MERLPDGFDPKLYLYLNPDVAEAGFDPIIHWNAFGRSENREYGNDQKKERIEKNRPNLAILLMCKNEGHVLDAWLKHHLNIVVPQNIFIFDNGSTDSITCEILSRAIKIGCNVELKFDSKKHFNSKGTVMVLKILELDLFENFDFYIPLDTDEFLAVEKDGSVESRADFIYSELALLPNIQAPLRIVKGLESNPFHKGYFKRTEISKSLFKRETIKSLDLGFHMGQTINGGTPFKTDLTLLDFHHMNFNEVKRRALEKLEGRVNINDKEALEKYELGKLEGFHLVQEILMNPDSYKKKFPLEEYEMQYGLFQSLDSSGVFACLGKVMSYE